MARFHPCGAKDLTSASAPEKVNRACRLQPRPFASNYLFRSRSRYSRRNSAKQESWRCSEFRRRYAGCASTAFGWSAPNQKKSIAQHFKNLTKSHQEKKSPLLAIRADRFFYLDQSDAFAGLSASDTIFLDSNHSGERGNAIVVRKIADGVRSSLTQGTRPRFRTEEPMHKTSFGTSHSVFPGALHGR
jgi:hypothetical protein